MTDSNSDKARPKNSTEEQAAEQPSKAAKRKAQHEHWMRVMMEGQSTPDLRYQKQKT